MRKRSAVDKRTKERKSSSFKRPTKVTNRDASGRFTPSTYKPARYFKRTNYSTADPIHSTRYSRAVKKSLPPLSYQEEALAVSMLDPGHSIDAIYQATPFPDGKMTADSYMLQGQIDNDISLSTDGDYVNVFLLNHPLISMMVIGVIGGASIRQCFPWNFNTSFKNPGLFLQGNGINGIRCLGKSMTCTNETPNQTRGGIWYSSSIDSEPKLYNVDPVEPHLAANLGFNPGYEGIPHLKETMLAKPGYQVHDRDGVYVIARTTDGFDPHSTISEQYNVDPIYVDMDTTIPGTANFNALRYSTPASAITIPSTNVLWGNGGAYGLSVIVPCISDGSNIPCIHFSKPSGVAQTLHFKIHGLWEYVTRNNPNMSIQRPMKVHPNELLVQAIISSMEGLPTSMSSRDNDLATIWKRFKKIYNSPVMKKYLRPAFDTIVPWGGKVSRAVDFATQNF